MTLLEVLIAFSLTALLLLLLMFFYRDQDYVNVKLDKQEQEAFRMMYVENRLSQILPKTVSSYDVKHDFYFFTSSDANGVLKPGLPSLVFTFDNGNELDKSFSNHVLARLYVDKSNRLSLATLPSPNRWEGEHALSMKQEILMEDVEDLQFEFYVPPEKDRKIILEQAKSKGAQKIGETLPEILPKNHWHQLWKPDYKQLPAIVRINVALKSGLKMKYAFPLPNTDLVIMYEK